MSIIELITVSWNWPTFAAVLATLRRSAALIYNAKKSQKIAKNAQLPRKYSQKFLPLNTQKPTSYSRLKTARRTIHFDPFPLNEFELIAI